MTHGDSEPGTYVCVSPLGERNQAARLARTTMTKPMKILQLSSRTMVSCQSLILEHNIEAAAYPFAMIREVCKLCEVVVEVVSEVREQELI